MDDQMLHHFMEDLTPIIIIVTGTVAIAWVLSLIIGAFRQRLRLRAQTEFHNKILEKFSSADEFTAYLESNAGKSFFDNLSNEPAAPLTKILGAIQKGAILALLGLGLIVLGKSYTAQEGGNVMFVVGVISFMIGAGFLASSAISYRLAKNWGIISVDKRQISNVPNSV